MGRQKEATEKRGLGPRKYDHQPTRKRPSCIQRARIAPAELWLRAVGRARLVESAASGGEIITDIEDLMGGFKEAKFCR